VHALDLNILQASSIRDEPTSCRRSPHFSVSPPVLVEINERSTKTASYDSVRESPIVGVTSELLSENAQFDALTSDLSSHTAVFGSQPVSKGPKSRGPDHKMIVI
jgi:hypothetical protein